MSKKLKVQVPKELADELASEGLAEVVRTARSAFWELAWSAAPTAAVVVTLMQTPETVKAFADACLRILKKARPGKEQRLDAVGPGGQMRLVISSKTDLHEVERFLAEVIFTDMKPEEETE